MPYKYGTKYHMTAAQLLLKTRAAHAGGIVEMVVWQVFKLVLFSSDMEAMQ
jgi:hypothetical protein